MIEKLALYDSVTLKNVFDHEPRESLANEVGSTKIAIK
jgi:hypothetical protein